MRVGHRLRRKLSVALALGVFVWSIALEAPAPAAAGYYKISGHGKGHGVGLCMAGVLGRAKRDWRFRRIIYYYFKGVRVQKKQLPGYISVGVYSGAADSSVSVGANGGFKMVRRDGSGLLRIPSGQRAVVTYSEGTYTVRRSGDGKTVSTNDYVEARPNRGTILAVRNIKSTYNRYRGRIRVRYSSHSNLLWAINVVRLPHYIRGLAEEPDSWPMEGLKTLAVAARSYALACRREGKHAADNFNVCSSTGWQKYGGNCQYYLGYEHERNAPRLARADAVTARYVVTYRSRIAKTPYSSCCGGYTESFKNAWGSTNYPYCQVVHCTLCRYYSSSYNWRQDFTRERLQDIFDGYSDTNVGTFQSLLVTARTKSGRIATIQIRGSSGTKEITGMRLMALLSLKSTRCWLRWVE